METLTQVLESMWSSSLKSHWFFAALAGLVVVLQLRSHRRHQLHFLAKEQQLARGGGFLPSQFNSALQAQHPLLRSEEKLSLSFLASGLALCLPAQRIPSRSVETNIHCQHCLDIHHGFWDSGVFVHGECKQLDRFLVILDTPLSPQWNDKVIWTQRLTCVRPAAA